MGIDARILIRGVPQSRVTEEWLTEISWQLGDSIGAKHFFIKDGLPPDEHHEHSEAWHKAFVGHPLHAEYEAARKAEGSLLAASYSHEAHEKANELAKRIREDVGEWKDVRRRAIERTNTFYREEGEAPPGAEYHQDGDPIVANDGECLLQVSVWSRWYGQGYERGDLLTLCAIAEWIEANITGSSVWYGGDSSGVLAEPWPDAKRRELRQHLYSDMGRNYYASSWCRRDEFGLPKACSLCPGGIYRGQRFGAGGTFASFQCAGCGKGVETNDKGKTWTETKEGARVMRVSAADSERPR